MFTLEWLTETSKEQAEVLHELSVMRLEHYKLSEELFLLQRKLTDLERDFYLENAERTAVPDPATGRANKEYSRSILDKLMESDQEIMTTRKAMDELRVKSGELRTRIQNHAERLALIRSQNDLFSAWMTQYDG